jgi:hypothetical protein
MLIFEALQAARRYVVLAARRRFVLFWFSRKPLTHLVIFPSNPVGTPLRMDVAPDLLP